MTRSRLIAYSWLLVLFASAGFAALQEEPLPFRFGADETSRLASRVTDRGLTDAQRDTALSALERVDSAKAVELAPALLVERDESLRFRAAWLLAENGKQTGVQVLRQMLMDKNSGLTLAADALGRLRDAGSHGLLRDLLQAELGQTDRLKGRPRVSALVSGLADYGDPKDASLLSRAVTEYLDHGGVWDAEELGRTGGAEAVPVLEEIFQRRGKGWAVMSAGLALARCGSARGKDYVADRLADPRCCRAPLGTPEDGIKDDPFGPKATSFILDHLGVPADEIFVPILIRVVSSAEFSDTAKAQSWVALSKIDSVKYRPQLLELAWKNVGYDGAARLIVLNDEVRVQALRQSKQSKSSMQTSQSLETALAASPRERRRWRETRAYAF